MSSAFSSKSKKFEVVSKIDASGSSEWLDDPVEKCRERVSWDMCPFGVDPPPLLTGLAPLLMLPLLRPSADFVPLIRPANMMAGSVALRLYGGNLNFNPRSGSSLPGVFGVSEE